VHLCVCVCVWCVFMCHVCVCVCVCVWSFWLILHRWFVDIRFISKEPLRKCLEPPDFKSSVPWRKGAVFCPSENICRNECPSRIVHGIPYFVLFLKGAVHWRNGTNFTDYEILSIQWLIPVWAHVHLGWKWIKFFVKIQWIPVVSFRLLPARVCDCVVWSS
jgi:hypothetical protein